MAYCCQCGKPAQDVDRFCGECGAAQPAAASTAGGGISPSAASTLCYIPWLGWIPAVIMLASGRFRQDATVRFHAFQGVYIFVAWLVVDWALGPMMGFPLMHGAPRPWLLPGLSLTALLKGLLMFTWIFMLVKTSQGATYKLPLVGELAARSVAEQK
ncbi:MAG: hypothetical protein EHM65_01730 [Acidobacteriales bacterium]|nr:MAG: hypothetical protein EHM65_01730 [Terriglobales bacterium]